MLFAATLLLAVLAALAGAEGGQVKVVVDAAPREGGAVRVASAVTSGLLPQLPYTFFVPAGTQLALSPAPNAGYKLWYWNVNGTRYTGDTIALVAQGSVLTVTAVYGPNVTLTVTETAVATLYVSREGYVWVEPKPLQLELPELDQTVSATLSSAVRWVNQSYVDIFGVTRYKMVAEPSFALTLENSCRRTCVPVHFYVFHPNGTLAASVTLAGNSTSMPWPNRTAIVFVEVKGTGKLLGPYAPIAVEAAEPMPEDVLPFIPLLPLGIFVALAVRSSVRDAALGLAAYALFATPLLSAFGVSAAIPATAIGFTVAIALLVVDLFGKR